MTTPKTPIWAIESHTLAKHNILRRYLGAWFPILGSRYQQIIYVDGFCGPGRYEGGEEGSPLIALGEARKCADKLKDTTVVFRFMDKKTERIELLNETIRLEDWPANFQIQVQVGEFENSFRQLLDSVEKSKIRLPPTFAFIDPFGFSGMPYDLVRRLLNNQSTEVLINFPVAPVNRWHSHPEEINRQHIKELMGTDRIFEVASAPGANRIEKIRLLYQEQLQRCARFVRFFEMKNSLNQPIYDLFFASNNRLGHIKMKEAFWSVDRDGGYKFSDATDPHQLLLLDGDEALGLDRLLLTKFSKQTVPVVTVLDYVNDHTPFLEKHMKNSLNRLEADTRIQVNAQKADGTPRKKRTFPTGTIVNFA